MSQEGLNSSLVRLQFWTKVAASRVGYVVKPTKEAALVIGTRDVIEKGLEGSGHLPPFR